MVAGASFAKAAEHFAQAVPAASRALPQGAFDVVAAMGLMGAALVALGAIVAVPAFVRFVYTGGWSSIRGRVLRAIVLSVITAGSVVPLSVWAHHLDEFQRNGGDGVYSGAFVAWALFVAASLAQWTAAGVAAARRIDLPRRLLHVEVILAVAVAGAMVAITAGTAVWWVAMARNAPWFLRGTATGTSPSPFDLQLVMTMALMLLAVVAAAYGVVRVGRSWTGIRRASA